MSFYLDIQLRAVSVQRISYKTEAGITTHTSLNYSALLAGSRGSRTSIFFNPSAVLSLVGFVLQQCQGWAADY